MATKLMHTDGTTTFLMLSPAEAVRVISFLTAQLAGVAAPGQATGNVPEVAISERGKVVERFCFAIHRPETEK